MHRCLSYPASDGAYCQQTVTGVVTLLLHPACITAVYTNHMLWAEPLSRFAASHLIVAQKLVEASLPQFGRALQKWKQAQLPLLAALHCPAAGHLPAWHLSVHLRH